MTAPESASHTASVVAERIGKSEAWVLRHAPRLPHHKFGRDYRWSEGDIAEILRIHSHRPEPANTPRELRPLGRRSA